MKILFLPDNVDKRDLETFRRTERVKTLVFRHSQRETLSVNVIAEFVNLSQDVWSREYLVCYDLCLKAIFKASHKKGFF